MIAVPIVWEGRYFLIEKSEANIFPYAQVILCGLASPRRTSPNSRWAAPVQTSFGSSCKSCSTRLP